MSIFDYFRAETQPKATIKEKLASTSFLARTLEPRYLLDAELILEITGATGAIDIDNSTGTPSRIGESAATPVYFGDPDVIHQSPGGGNFHAVYLAEPGLVSRFNSFQLDGGVAAHQLHDVDSNFNILSSTSLAPNSAANFTVGSSGYIGATWSGQVSADISYPTIYDWNGLGNDCEDGHVSDVLDLVQVRAAEIATSMAGSNFSDIADEVTLSTIESVQRTGGTQSTAVYYAWLGVGQAFAIDSGDVTNTAAEINAYTLQMQSGFGLLAAQTALGNKGIIFDPTAASTQLGGFLTTAAPVNEIDFELADRQMGFYFNDGNSRAFAGSAEFLYRTVYALNDPTFSGNELDRVDVNGPVATYSYLELPGIDNVSTLVAQTDATVRFTNGFGTNLFVDVNGQTTQVFTFADFNIQQGDNITITSQQAQAGFFLYSYTAERLDGGDFSDITCVDAQANQPASVVVPSFPITWTEDTASPYFGISIDDPEDNPNLEVEITNISGVPGLGFNAAPSMLVSTQLITNGIRLTGSDTNITNYINSFAQFSSTPPTNFEGPLALRLCVDDGENQTCEDFSANVFGTPDDPTLSAPPSLTLTEGQRIPYVYVYQDPDIGDTATVTYNWTFSADFYRIDDQGGAVIYTTNGNTGTLTGAAANVSAATLTGEITIPYGVGLVGMQSVSLTGTDGNAIVGPFTTALAVDPGLPNECYDDFRCAHELEHISDEFYGGISGGRGDSGASYDGTLDFFKGTAGFGGPITDSEGDTIDGDAADLWYTSSVNVRPIPYDISLEGANLALYTGPDNLTDPTTELNLFEVVEGGGEIDTVDLPLGSRIYWRILDDNVVGGAYRMDFGARPETVNGVSVPINPALAAESGVYSRSETEYINRTQFEAANATGVSDTDLAVNAATRYFDSSFAARLSPQAAVLGSYESAAVALSTQRGLTDSAIGSILISLEYRTAIRDLLVNRLSGDINQVAIDELAERHEDFFLDNGVSTTDPIRMQTSPGGVERVALNHLSLGELHLGRTIKDPFNGTHLDSRSTANIPSFNSRDWIITPNIHAGTSALAPNGLEYAWDVRGDIAAGNFTAQYFGSTNTSVEYFRNGLSLGTLIPNDPFGQTIIYNPGDRFLVRVGTTDLTMDRGAIRMVHPALALDGWVSLNRAPLGSAIQPTGLGTEGGGPFTPAAIQEITDDQLSWNATVSTPTGLSVSVGGLPVSLIGVSAGGTPNDLQLSGDLNRFWTSPDHFLQFEGLAGNYNVTYTLADGVNTRTLTQLISIDGGLNTPPVFTFDNAKFTTQENTAATIGYTAFDLEGFSDGSLVLTADNGATISVTGTGIDTTNVGQVTINGSSTVLSSLTIMVTPQTGNTEDVTITATLSDGEATAMTQTATLCVDAVNTPPTSEFSVESININQGNAASTTINYSDDDGANEAGSVLLTADNPNVTITVETDTETFTGQGSVTATGNEDDLNEATVTVTPLNTFTGTINISLVPNDGTDNGPPDNLQVIVDPLNNRPTITIPNITFNANAVGTGTFSVFDQDGDPLTGNVIGYGAVGSLITNVSGTNGATGQVGLGGVITFSAPTGSATFTITINIPENAAGSQETAFGNVSDGSLTGMGEGIVTINAIPTVVAQQNFFGFEDQLGGLIPGGGGGGAASIDDPESDDFTELTLRLNAANVGGGGGAGGGPATGGAFMFAGLIGLAVTGDGTNDAEISGAKGEINNFLAGGIPYQPGPDQSGTVVITMTVVDGGGAESIPQTFTMTFDAVADDTTFNVAQNFTATAGEAFTLSSLLNPQNQPDNEFITEVILSGLPVEPNVNAVSQDTTVTFINGMLTISNQNGIDMNTTITFPSATSPQNVTVNGSATVTQNPSVITNFTFTLNIAEAPDEDEVLIGDKEDNDLETGEGNDTVKGKAGDDTINTNGGDDNVSGGQGNDTINAGDGVDLVRGGRGDDIIDGGNGNDVLRGGLGNDTINGGEGNDTIRGGQGNDTLSGGLGVDIIRGGQGDDMIDGGEGNDILRGGQGNDTIKGGAGSDNIRGGQGNDTFIIDLKEHLENGDLDKIRGGQGYDKLIINITQEQANDTTIMNALQSLKYKVQCFNKVVDSFLGLDLRSVEKLIINILPPENEASFIEEDDDDDTAQMELPQEMQTLVAHLENSNEIEVQAQEKYFARNIAQAGEKFDADRSKLVSLLS